MTYRYVTGYCNEEASDGKSGVGAETTTGTTPNEEPAPSNGSDRTTPEPTDEPEPKRHR